MADNTVLSAAVGTGDTVRDFADGGSVKRPAAVCCYIASGSAGAWVPQQVDAAHGLPVSVTGTVAVSGTFWQATQPVSVAVVPSHDVTNAGTFAVQVVALPAGLATSAKQDTGNTSLSSLDAKTPALGQALAAASVPVVLAAAQLSTSCARSRPAWPRSRATWTR